jgi:hypothetical protein
MINSKERRLKDSNLDSMLAVQHKLSGSANLSSSLDFGVYRISEEGEVGPRMQKILTLLRLKTHLGYGPDECELGSK